MEKLMQDLRYAARMLLKNPGFTGVAVLTLALGIGANTAIFTVLDAVMLRQLPVKDPQQLVVLTNPDAHGANFGSESGDRSLLAYSEFEYLRDHNEVCSGIFAADSRLAQVPVVVNAPAGGSGAQEGVAGIRLVSGGYFGTLGVNAWKGRTFGPEVDRVRGDAPYAVLSYGFWQRRLGGSPSVLGSTMRIRKTAFQVIGVAPAGFFGETVGDATDVWIPMMMQDAVYPGRDLLSPSPDGIVNIRSWLQVIGRRKQGVSTAQAKANLSVVFKQMLEGTAAPGMSAAERKDAVNQQLDVQPGGRGASELHERFGEPLKVLMGLVGLVLLIACANVANLLLARGAARQKEMAVRLAIGAGRFQLLRQLLTESALLALLGATGGLVLAQWMDAVLVGLVSKGARSPVSMELSVDARVLGFTLATALLTALFFGLIPALRATRFDLSPILKSTGAGLGGVSGRRRVPATKLLVIAQVAISLVLLVTAGLFVHSLIKLSQVALGYDSENLLLFRVDPTPSGYKGATASRLHQQLLEKFAAIPGVRRVSASEDGLFSQSEAGDPIWVEGYQAKSDEHPHTRMDHVAPAYFATVGIPVLLGREFTAQDAGNGSPRAALVNQEFVRTYFAQTNPIGKHIRDTYPNTPPTDENMEIVGVVADAKYNSLREKNITRLYAPYFNPLWEQNNALMYEVRTAMSGEAISGAVRQILRETDGNLSAPEIHSMSGLVADYLGSDRLVAGLSGALGLLAVLLASIGLYGVMAYSVARQVRDIGIRMALGAQAGSVLRGVLRDTLVLVAIGVAIGLPMALGGARLLASLLFGMGLADPASLALAAAILMIVALLAAALPARRASRVDPMVALRYE